MRWILLCLVLTGCADHIVNTCPEPVVYSTEFQNKAADEVDALPPGSAVGQMLVDYGQERAALRACR